MQYKHLFGYLGLAGTGPVHYQLTPAELVEHTLLNGDGEMADSGGLCVNTGEFTGRSPKDKFVVKDATTENEVWWGHVNQPFAPEAWTKLKARVLSHLRNRELYVRDCYAGADPTHRIAIRVINETAWSNLFCHNLFLRPTEEELFDFKPEWTIVQAPSFMAIPALDGTRQHNFTILNFTEKIILIGGSGYTGEMKKGIFSVLNFTLPLKNVLSMHCSANIGQAGDTAVFFGLSGTGKTTLSADPLRSLIGDDEHGWTDQGVFNFEGGCYAKCVDLTQEKEPQIWEAIRFQTLIENTRFELGTRTVDYTDVSITENTRAAYPIYFIPNAAQPSVGGHPRNIFMLTADAFGVLPPISKLTTGQAMYYFLSGYTAKVAGTEMGVTEPQATFSACFGSAFLPLHPTRYATLLGQKMQQHNVNVWLINTGWTGGSYGTGERIKLRFTRAMITAALNGSLDSVAYENHPVFGLPMPAEVPGVPSEILNPRNTWADKAAYDATAAKLADLYAKNFAQYAEYASEEIKAAAPKVMA
jgi:phosphoenolpyruvate carboxykinase (ATP)